MLLLTSPGLAGQGAVLSARVEERTVMASVALDSAPVDRVLAALRDGLKSEIIFELRLYRRQQGFLAWLGDRPVATRRASRVAFFDPFTNLYVILQNGRAVASFAEQEQFLRRFLVYGEYALGEIAAGDEGRYYVVARVRLSPVRIIPPLNIVTLFSSESLLTTDWVERALGPP